MKFILYFFSILLSFFQANGKEKTYTASTPPHHVIRSFLGISFTDSIDFIRWKFTLSNNRYELQCQYGLGKANTNGFINGGSMVKLKGEWHRENNYLQFQNGTKKLKAIEINPDLLHLLDDDNRLLVGNGAWSFTLNNITPSHSQVVNVIAAPTILKDSIVFEGRTPCDVPGVIAPGTLCYKLKWRLVLYANAKSNQPKSYALIGTPWRRQVGKTGTWKMMRGQTGGIIYQLKDEEGIGFLYLLKLDDHILVFTDAQGKLLVGNEDFSYTLNEKK